MSDLSFYSNNNWHNNLYALDLAIESFYSNLLFNGDGTRIIYASNANAFRKRVGKNSQSSQGFSNLLLPFMNYYLKSITLDTTRKWFNHLGNIDGVWVEEIQDKLRIVPVRVAYEATVFYHRNDDLHYSVIETMFNNSNETILRPTITINNQDIELLAIEYRGFNFEPEFEQKDWFEKNKIHSATLNFEYDFSLFKDTDKSFGIPDKVILEWGRLASGTEMTLDETHNFLINRFTEEVIEE